MLIGLGLRTVRQRGAPRPAVLAGTRLAYGSSLALVLSNPMTMLSYLAVASSGAEAAGNAEALFSPWSVPGVMAGAGAGYAVPSAGASMVRTGISASSHRNLNLVAGSMLVLFGIWVALR